MQSLILISISKEIRAREIERILSVHNLSPNHPDLLYFPDDSKLGISEARKIKEHFSLKPYSAKGRAVVLGDASNLTHEAQNALLKTLEEPPAGALLILGAPSEHSFLPTILSRCQVIILDASIVIARSEATKQSILDIEKLIKSTIDERFEYVEKLKNREDFLHSMVEYFHQKLSVHPGGGHSNFLKELLQAEEWAQANVNIRAILEYLMLVMPKRS